MDIKLDENGDIAIENGDLVLLRGSEAIAQDISIRLKWFLGEWFLDTRLGVPYYQKVLGKKPNLPVVKNIFRKVILGTPGVIEITNYQMTFDGVTRKLRVVFDGNGTDGPFKYDKELIV